MKNATTETICINDKRLSPSVKAWLELSRIVDLGQRDLSNAMRRHGLNVGQIHLLMAVRENEGLNQQDLASDLCHSKANVSQLLDKMELAGLVSRSAIGRSHHIRLTEAGRALLDEVVPELESIVDRQFAALEETDRSLFFRLLDSLFVETLADGEIAVTD